MASMQRAPKQWCLTKSETISSFESWKQNLIYILSLDPNFAPFLNDGVTWQKKTKSAPLRGFTDDPAAEPAASRHTAQQKVNYLELMLGQIANFCPVISRNTLVKNSTSIECIWQTIRLHFGFQTTGGHLLDFSEIQHEPDEWPEDLYQRLTAFIEDNLLRANGITHNDQKLEEDEEMSPTLENVIVLHWLKLIHPELPKLVKQRYGTELRSRTLASIKPEISQALDSLLDELHTNESAKVLRTAAASRYKPKSSYKHPQKPSRIEKCCPLCKQAGRVDREHFLSECKFLPEQDRRYMVRARQIMGIIENDDSEECEPPTRDPSPLANRIQVRQSPYIDTFYKHFTARITIDSGATGNMISLAMVERFNAEIRKSSQSAHQADGSSPLEVIGETTLTFVRDNQKLMFEGLVIKNLDVDILAGTPFMECNDIAIRPARREVTLKNGSKYVYGSHDKTIERHAVRRAYVIRAPKEVTTIWPGDFIEVEIPSDIPADCDYAIEPRAESTVSWPSVNIVSSIAGKIRIPNMTNEPHTLKRNEHFCQIRPVFVPESDTTCIKPQQPHKRTNNTTTDYYTANVHLDPDNILPTDIVVKFRSTLREYDSIFNPNIKGYNGASGPFEAKVNMGPTQPPQRKGRLPQYAHNQLVELQEKFDALESQGVFKRPEDVGITVEYLNPSFLVKKPKGGFRLVTAFTDVGRYSKPQPSLLPDVDSTLRRIAQWKYIITTDLTSAFYQIPLSRDSLKYCGVCTPFRGVRVYVRSAMGMPGSETALEELMCRIVGHLIQEGCIAKIADDLFIGGNNPEELLHNFRRVLQALHANNICLSAAKTFIAPKVTTILGWVWSLGTLQASSHRVATLASCKIPEKVKELRSFIGAYKVLARVIPQCAGILDPLDTAAAGRESKDKIEWSDDLRQAFMSAQKSLATNRVITLPRPDDILWIVTDGAFRNTGLGATLYITRGKRLLVAGFFSAKLRNKQCTWLPCEIEALAIAAAIKHFSPYIIQSQHKACVLTDSKPCVQAFEKLCRGEFSASPRVSTFLSTASRYQVSIRHVSGSSILQSDFASRNAPPCDNKSCQVCSFIVETEESVVRRTPVSIPDILTGVKKLPFTNRVGWLNIQSECQDLRRAKAHLKQGTRPSKKVTNARDVKRYLNAITIAKDGLLVVPQNEPLAPTRERIVIPRQVLDGLLTALHIQLCHPSCHQLKQVAHRYLFALDMDKAIEDVSMNCHTCASLRNTPHVVVEQSTCEPPDTVGVSFATDIVRRNRQYIIVLRECVTSYTLTSLVEDERHDTLRDVLIRLCGEIKPLDGPPAVIRTDAAPAFKSLVTDKELTKHRIAIEIGRIKNPNKNPVAERAVQELELELLKLDPTGGVISAKNLALATATLNTRIRSRGLSAREMWTQRDQFTNRQINMSDQELIQTQETQRKKNHPYSEYSKAPKGNSHSPQAYEVGELVYLYNDRNKTSPRDRYLITSVDNQWCNVRKLVGAQLRNASYRVKRSEIFRVPQHKQEHTTRNYKHCDMSDEGEEFDIDPPPPQTPEIPQEISTPPLGDNTPDIMHNNTTDDTDVESDMSQTATPALRRSARDRKQTQFYGEPISFL